MATNKGRGKFGAYVAEVTEKFNSLYVKNKKEVDDYIQRVKDSKDYKDFETRIAWDIARAAKYQTWGFWPKTRGGYIDATNDQLTTLFKQALKKSNIKLNPENTKKSDNMARQTSFNFTKRGCNSTKAAKILKENREEYGKLLKKEIAKQKGKKSVTKAAKAASKKHHKMTWRQALKAASK